MSTLGFENPRPIHVNPLSGRKGNSPVVAGYPDGLESAMLDFSILSIPVSPRRVPYSRCLAAIEKDSESFRPEADQNAISWWY